MKRITIQIKKRYYASITLIITALILSLFFALPVSTQPDVKQAGSESQLKVKIAYAYVGPVPADKASYYSTEFNETMVHDSKYPSAVYLNFTRIPSIQISSCDAVIQVYGIKISSDTGRTEYHAWTAGLAFTKFSTDDLNILISHSDELINRSLYRSIGGDFLMNWTADRSILSHKIGSVGDYTGNHSAVRENIFDLSSAGKPSTISVEVYRIGYVTMSNGSVNTYKDAITTDKSVAYVQLNKFGDGFIYNDNTVPLQELSLTDLFHPDTLK